MSKDGTNTDRFPRGAGGHGGMDYLMLYFTRGRWREPRVLPVVEKTG